MGFGPFRHFLQVLLPCANMSSHRGGGGCVHFLKSARKRHFRNVWVGAGGGGLPFFSVAQHTGRCTQTWHCTVHPFLFRITVIVSIPFFRQGWDPIRAEIPLFVDRDIFLQFLPILHPSCLHWHPTFVKGHGPQAIGCEVHVSHAGGCEREVRGFFYPATRLMPSHLHPLYTPRASPFARQRLLWCIRGSNSPWREFV